MLVALMLSANLLNAQNESTLYSFFIAGHTSGVPGVNSIGLYQSFKDKFGYIQSREEIEFGVLLGDIVVQGGATAQDWDEVDADIDSLGLPVYFAVGNHDMENRPLFESRYGPTYYSFIYQDDLFIVLDPNIDGWSIKGEQLEFLENVIDTTYQDVDNIFVLFHQLLWLSENNIYANICPNSFEGRVLPTNFWTDIEPLFHQLPNNVTMCAGDMGAVSWSNNFMYDLYDNISFAGTGMGEGDGDNFIVINVAANKAISYDLICLNDTALNCFGELTDYQISLGDNEIVFRGFVIYPNPAKSYVSLEFINDISVNIQLFNMTGQMVFEKQLSHVKSHSFNIDYLPKGLYFIKVDNGFSRFTEKLVVE